MSNERDKALSRYHKVLELTRSPELHEAQTAKRHADALERKYGFSASTLEFNSYPLVTRFPVIPEYAYDMASVIADSMGCALVYSSERWFVCGPLNRPGLVAGMTIELLSQLRRDRSAYIVNRSRKIPDRRKDRLAFTRALRRDYERGWAMGAIVAVRDMPWYMPHVIEADLATSDDSEPVIQSGSAYQSQAKPKESYWSAFHHACSASVPTILKHSPVDRLSSENVAR